MKLDLLSKIAFALALVQKVEEAPEKFHASTFWIAPIIT
jgi:hypothetical protein